MRDRPTIDLPIPALWLVWDTTIVYRLIRQTTVALARRGGRISFRERTELERRLKPQQRALAQSLGIDVREGGSRVTCPTCRRPARWIQWENSQWWCRECVRSRYGEDETDRFHLMLSRYQFALMIGAAGKLVEQRRLRVAQVMERRIRSGRPKSTRMVHLLMIGAGLLEIPILWRRSCHHFMLHRTPFTASPFFLAVAQHLMPATLDMWLRPEVYKRRYLEMLRAE